MKKIVLASAAMGGAALVAFGASGTFAAFSDTGSATVPAAQAGTLFLQESSPTATTTGLNVNNLAPGDVVTYYTAIRNAGSLPGFISGRIVSETQRENGCVGGEEVVDRTCGDDTSGELAANTSVRSTYGSLRTGQSCDASYTGGQSYDAGTLSDLTRAQEYSQPAPIAAGETACSIITVTVNSNAGNEIQSDQFSFRYDYRLTQLPAQNI
ncbi:hypothetical protein ASG36_17535 [Geodermatophilus sp. Leaf369]|uniref:TasA family protein n=1 Tax=Geodermatophilus sp. Leaf369 TaxID=1736354 RepID=UPI0006F7B6DF|nr:TasA family protein [Geodermatophilus sp. Leaf369]KQS56829.1 hypothetical protein ASG36_17535 [Geodermatophilus sp. Leaf369]